MPRLALCKQLIPIRERLLSQLHTRTVLCIVRRFLGRLDGSADQQGAIPEIGALKKVSSISNSGAPRTFLIQLIPHCLSSRRGRRRVFRISRTLPSSLLARIIAFATACASGDLRLSAAQPPDEVIKKLVSLPGIGPWTAHYIAMRALRWPDAFPKEDIAIRNNLGGMSSKEAEARSQSWRPWRSYAVMHIWKSLG